MSLVHNEQRKLTANWLNTRASGIIITGSVAPLVAFIYGVQGTSQIRYAVLGLLSVVWVSIGATLHIAGRQLLKGLRT